MEWVEAKIGIIRKVEDNPGGRSIEYFFGREDEVGINSKSTPLLIVNEGRDGFAWSKSVYLTFYFDTLNTKELDEQTVLSLSYDSKRRLAVIGFPGIFLGSNETDSDDIVADKGIPLSACELKKVQSLLLARRADIGRGTIKSGYHFIPNPASP